MTNQLVICNMANHYNCHECIHSKPHSAIIIDNKLCTEPCCCVPENFINEQYTYCIVIKE